MKRLASLRCQYPAGAFGQYCKPLKKKRQQSYRAGETLLYPTLQAGKIKLQVSVSEVISVITWPFDGDGIYDAIDTKQLCFLCFLNNHIFSFLQLILFLEQKTKGHHRIQQTILSLKVSCD